MARLTAAIRDGIIANAIKTKDFAGRDLAIVQKRADFVERLRKYALAQYGLTDARIAEIKESIEAITKEVTLNGNKFIRVDLTASNSVWDVNIAGQTRRLYRNGICGGIARPLFDSSEAEYDKSTYHPHYHENDFIVSDPKWLEELNSIDREAESLREEYNTLQSTLKATISGFTTVEKLLEAWPDAKELIPETTQIAKQPGTGIALSVADLNAMCGIPTGN